MNPAIRYIQLLKALLCYPLANRKEKKEISKLASIEHGETHFHAKENELNEFLKALDLLEEMDSNIYESLKKTGSRFIYDSNIDFSFTLTSCRLSRDPEGDESDLVAKIVVYYFKHKQAQEQFTKTLKEDPDFIQSDFRLQSWANELTERLNQS
jgi:hypothetical protein